MIEPRHSEAAFETVIEAHLLQHEYARVADADFDRERAIFPNTVLAFIRETQPNEWAKLETLHGDNTAEQILSDLCKWMDANGSLATLRHGFKAALKGLTTRSLSHTDVTRRSCAKGFGDPAAAS